MTQAKDYIEIIQLTDSHLFSDKSVGLYGLNSLDALEKVIQAVKKARQFDLVVMTGDLVHDESEGGYRLLKQALSPLGKPVHLIPGNHDDLTALTPLLDDVMTCNKQVQLGQWQILLLNTQHTGQVGGHLSDKELKWLEATLSKTKHQHTVVCLHHHPVPMGSKWLDQIALDNADRLFEILALYPQVKALLWGHVHQTFDEVRAGLRLLATPSTCIQFKPNQSSFVLDELPPGYRWLRLFEDGSIETGVERLPNIPGTLDPEATGY